MVPRRPMRGVYDAVVAGAGPAGAATARDIAAAGFSVLLVEEHGAIGEPLHCSGLVTPRTLALAGAGDCLVRNELTGAFINLASGTRLAIGAEETTALAIDRVALDHALVAQAQERGAVLKTGMKLTDIERAHCHLSLQLKHHQGTVRVETRLLIGADGAQSRVASWLGRDGPADNLVGLSVEAKLTPERRDCVELFIGNAIAPGFFGWLIPLADGRARVGVATNAGRRPVHYLRELIARFPRVFRGAEFGRLSGGVIPLRHVRRPYADNVMLVGDAAGQVKPTSGGGIYSGLVGARHCAAAAVAALSRDDVSEARLRCYGEAWQRELGGEFQRMQSLREAFLSLSDAELELLAGFLQRPALQRLIRLHGDIDFPSRLFSRPVKLLPAVARLASRLPWLRAS